MQDNYDETFKKTVYGSPHLTVEEVLADVQPDAKVVRVEYDDKQSFKAIAKHLGFMDDFKVGDDLGFNYFAFIIWIIKWNQSSVVFANIIGVHL